MTKRWAEVYVRSDEEVERLVVALVREPVEFRVSPEHDGWWRVRATTAFQGDLDQLRQAAVAEVTRAAL